MMTAEQLKASILQLAMQGKLVEQRPEDGTGEELYKEIQAEKKNQIKRGKIKKQKDVPAISEEEIPFEIVDSWKWAKLGNIISFRMGKTPPRAEALYWGNDIPWVSIADMNDGKVISETKECISFKALEDRFGGQISPKGTLIMSFKLTVGKVSILGMDAVHNEAIISILPFVDANNAMRDYLKTVLPLLSVYGKSKKAIMGFTLNSTSLADIPIPLPPLAEQKRIVAKIEELMPFVEQYAAASTKLNTLNTTFPDMMKKSILQEAVQGKLVPQDPNDEPASVLLKKIAEEKKRLIKEGKIKKDKNTSRIAREGNSWFEFADGQKTCIDDEIPFEIPDNWSWVRLNELGDYKKGPFGSALTKSMFVPAGPNSIKVYEQKNAIQKDWTLGEYYIRKEYYEEKMYGFTVEGGDVIVSCAGTIGETYVMPDDIELGIINQALMRMKIYEPINVNYFLMYFDYVIKGAAREQSKGSAIKNIPPFAIFKRILFPMPPLSEQDRILSRLTEILLEVDKLG